MSFNNGLLQKSLILIVFFAASCQTNKKCKVVEFSNYYYEFFSEIKHKEIEFILTEIEFGEAYADSSFIKVGIGLVLPEENSYDALLYYSSGDTLELIEKKDFIFTFYGKNIKQNVCNEEQLFLKLTYRKNDFEIDYPIDLKKGKKPSIRFH